MGVQPERQDRKQQGGQSQQNQQRQGGGAPGNGQTGYRLKTSAVLDCAEEKRGKSARKGGTGQHPADSHRDSASLSVLMADLRFRRVLIIAWSVRFVHASFCADHGNPFSR